MRQGLVVLVAIWLICPEVEAEDGDLLYGPGGAEFVRTLASDTTPPEYGAVPADVVQRIIDRADGFLGSTYSYSVSGFSYVLGPVQPESHTDSFPYWTGMFQERSDSISTRINSYTFAFLATGRVEYMDEALGMVLSLCAWDDWSDPDYHCYPGPACLDTGHLVMSVAYFYDAVRGMLSDTDRNTIVEALVNKGLIPLATACDYSLEQPAHNIQAIIAAGLGLGAAALMEEDARASGWLDTAMTTAEHWLDAQGTDGGAIEYHGYGSYALDYFVRLLHVASFHGRTLDHEFLQNVSMFFYSALAPDGSSVGTFGDSWPVCGAESMMYLASRGDAIAQAYLVDTGMIYQDRERGRVTDFMTIAWVDGYLEPHRPAPVPWVSRWVGFGAMRSADDTHAALVVFKSGPPEADVGHNQKDHLSYQVWAKGSWLTGDPGYSKKSQGQDLYRFYEEAFGHSSIVVDRTGPEKKNGAYITKVAGGEGFGLLCGEAAPSYPEGLASSVSRCILMTPDGFLVLFDSVEADLPRQVEWLHQPQHYGVAMMTDEGGDLMVSGARLAIRPVGENTTEHIEDFAHTGGYPKTLVIRSQASDLGEDVMLENSGFEADDWTGWHPRGSTLDAHSLDPEAHTGDHAARISLDTRDSGYFYSDRIPVLAGETFRAKAFVRSVDIDGSGAMVRLVFWSTDGYLSDARSSYLKGNWDWHQRSVSGVVPEGAVEMSVALELSQSTGSVWFDDVSVRKLGIGEDASSSQKLATLLYPTASSWMLNPDFSLGLLSWVPRATTGEAHGIDEGVFHSAPAAARISFTDTADAGYFYGPFVPVFAGDELRTSTWLKAEIDGGSGARLRLLFYSGNSYLDSVQTDYLTGSSDWTLQRLSAVVPDDANRIRIALEFNGIGTAWFDDVDYENLTNPIDASDLAGPRNINGSHEAFSFVRNGDTNLVLNAMDGLVAEDTVLGRSELDMGVAVRTMRSAQLVDGSRFSAGDGVRIETDVPGCVKVGRQDSMLVAKLYAGSEGEPPQGVMIQWPNAEDISSAEVNGEPALLEKTGDMVRACYGIVFCSECEPRLAGISVFPAYVEALPGSVVEMSVHGVDQFGMAREVEDTVLWSMMEEAAGTVDADGHLVLGEVPGRYPRAIRAQVGDLDAFADIVVLQQCIEDSDCDDSDPCTVDRCDSMHLCLHDDDPACHQDDGGMDGGDGTSDGDADGASDDGEQDGGCRCDSGSGSGGVLWVLFVVALMYFRMRLVRPQTGEGE